MFWHVSNVCLKWPQAVIRLSQRYMEMFVQVSGDKTVQTSSVDKLHWCASWSVFTKTVSVITSVWFEQQRSEDGEFVVSFKIKTKEVGGRRRKQNPNISCTVPSVMPWCVHWTCCYNIQYGVWRDSSQWDQWINTSVLIALRSCELHRSEVSPVVWSHISIHICVFYL